MGSEVTALEGLFFFALPCSEIVGDPGFVEWHV